ncbi:MAG: NUDIX hydrolase [Xanthobacteraceae bacterium]|nr:NUDIX hydrolase [Xanthobacteraceae bacterium]QYK44230.1 MAG: NUDIX hydrolase [Xanthobacteraceae bacterium]HMN51945.1 NUDIX hydrolase [Xanthobacteraceae bacterium]
MKITRLNEIDVRLEPREWRWATDNRNDILAHFERMRAQRPGMWNGRVLLVHRWQIDGEVLRAAMFETDFASLVTHRAFGFPDEGIFHCASGGVLRTTDGAFVLGVMGLDTANAGRIYFPAGTPDPGDIREDGSVDLAANLVRELDEEAGLIPGEYTVTPGWTAVNAGSRLALLREIDLPLEAEALAEKIRGNIAKQRVPELADVVIVRTRADFSPAMPGFVRAYLNAKLPPEAA